MAVILPPSKTMVPLFDDRAADGMNGGVGQGDRRWRRPGTWGWPQATLAAVSTSAIDVLNVHMESCSQQCLLRCLTVRSTPFCRDLCFTGAHGVVFIMMSIVAGFVVARPELPFFGLSLLGRLRRWPESRILRIRAAAFWLARCAAADRPRGRSTCGRRSRFARSGEVDGERIARPDDEVGVLARFERADPAGRSAVAWPG